MYVCACVHVCAWCVRLIMLELKIKLGLLHSSAASTAWLWLCVRVRAHVCARSCVRVQTETHKRINARAFVLAYEDFWQCSWSWTNCSIVCVLCTFITSRSLADCGNNRHNLWRRNAKRSSSRMKTVGNVPDRGQTVVLFVFSVPSLPHDRGQTVVLFVFSVPSLPHEH